MPKRGKAYLEKAKLVEKNRLYSPSEAMALVKETAPAKFDETVEAAVRLNVDPKHADQMVRGAVVLPSGTGKTRRVLVFAKGERAREAQEAGADIVGDEELVARVEGGFLDFDVAIATPDMMGAVGKLGRLLGPKGLMPNPKSGTVTMDVKNAVREFKGGKIEYRVDRTGIIHAPVGKVSFSPEALEANFHTLIDALVKARPATVKGQYIKSITVSSTMGPGIKVNPLEATRVAARE